MSYTKKFKVSYNIFINIILNIFNYRKSYKSNRGDAKSYSSYPDKKEKGNEPTPALDLKNNKSEPEPAKDQEKAKESEPSKPKDIKPTNE